MGEKMENKEIEIKINEVLDKIRPYLENDGGSVKFNRYEDGIETALVNEIPEVIKVINEN